MYTQCSKCETVFKLSADVLRTAGGQVRCGKCGEVFNALARLAEDAGAFATGESQLDLEARADSILESAAPRVAHEVSQESDEFGAPGVEIARLEVLDWNSEEQERHRETDVFEPGTVLPPGSRLGAGTAPGSPAAPARGAAPGRGSAPGRGTAPGRETAGAEVAPEPPAAPASEDGGAHTAALEDNALEFTLPPGELDRIFIDANKGARPRDADSADLGAELQTRMVGHEVPEDVRRDMLEGALHPEQPASVYLNSGRLKRRGQFAAWLGAAIIAALLLLVQVVHRNRERLVADAHGPVAATVRALYGWLGTPLPAPASLSAYQLRQWGVTGDPDANGTLRVRASILNTAAQLQPYPQLRVTLADRFGKTIGRRDFEPAEYLGKPPVKLLAPGERTDATLTILDPGRNAEGFEIDVCLRGADQRVSCANDVAAQAKR